MGVVINLFMPLILLLGHWPIWKISKMFEAARALAIKSGFLALGKYAERDITMVIVKQQIDLNPKVHELRLKKKFPMLFELKLLEVGKTSVLYVTEFKDGSTGEVLGQNFLKFVRMNSRTRRPFPFPEFFREAYGTNDMSVRSEVLPKRPLPEIPKTAYKSVVIARHSDMDRNNHVNQCSYIKFCMDHATHASISGYYAYYTQDMCLYAPLQWTISHVGECFANDELHIYTWQADACVPEHIEFAILMKDNMILHASTIFDKEPKTRRQLLTYSNKL